TFGSAVSVRNFREILGADRIAQLSEQGCSYAAIGPIAEEAAKELGISVDIVPEVHRVPDLVEAIVRFEARGGP
ncbi:MAG: uroporphyrinogen-III synthase, partial [Candidatus Hydrogenedentes bacterium]|nr:uroporphyrinogen-III synthase [Candidatus Hydrogenedentota bacterium]